MKLLFSGLFLFGLAIAAPPSEQNQYSNYKKTADKEFLEKQEAVLELFNGIYHPYRNQKYIQYAYQFDPEANINKFSNSQAVKRFLKSFYSDNFLPKNEVFSPSSQQHQNQVAQLFYFFYNAQDFNTFKQAAAWAKAHFNPGQFVYAFAAAVVNRPDTRGIILPPFYEIFPDQYVPATALRQIYNAYYDGYNKAYAYANYTSQNKNNFFYNYFYYNNFYNSKYNSPHSAKAFYANDDGAYYNNAGTPENPENRMSYFTEDVGINAFQTGFYTQYPSFFGYNYYYNYYTKYNNNNNENSNNNNNNQNQYSFQDQEKGEAFYYANQQFYARYVLERLSNDLPIPHPINFYKYVKPGYNPNLQYVNGQAVPARPPNTYFQQQENDNNNNNNNAQQPYNYQAQNPQVYEHRIHKVADSGYFYAYDSKKYSLNSQNGVGILANIIAFPASSPNPDYYGDFFSTAKNAIGNIVDPNNQNGVAPGAVSNYATAARDPAYYQFLANVLQVFFNYQNKQGPYTQSQVAFPGVKVESFDVEKLVTYFDTYDVNVNNAFAGFYYRYNQSGNYNYDYNHHNNHHNDNNHNNDNRNNNNDHNNHNNDNSNNNNDYNNRNNDNNDRNNDNNNRNNDNNNYPGNYSFYKYDYHVKFQRLNHNPFTYKFSVNSDKAQNAVVRVFVGPKYDSNGQGFTLAQASQYYFQLDQFFVQLNQGSNQFERSSRQSPVFVGDVPSYKTLKHRVEQALQGSQAFYYSEGESYHCGFPARAQLPKGKKGGQEFIFYTIVSPYNNESSNYNKQNGRYFDSFYCGGYYQSQYQDGRPYGFPFDRPVQESNFNAANQFFKTVTIFHKNHPQDS
ncbi:hexamerin-like [Lycorma delicatula]|uniref:hexamerin-like n=1 Tax=Lycorma delicatula TaxID=130591 RepID=UPI003F517B87